MHPETVLDLGNIREALVRMEDTIVFDLIERSQFFSSPLVYLKNTIKVQGFDGLFLEWLLLQLERIHSQVRRYEAPDEVAFFPDQLLPPLLPSLNYPKVLALYYRDVNVNSDIYKFYVENIVPEVACAAGEQQENSGLVAVCDVEALQALSRRIHFGKFVAEAKYQADKEGYRKLILARDVEGIERSITNAAVEAKILERLVVKCDSYGVDPSLRYSQKSQSKVKLSVIAQLYKEYVIPLTKKVEVDYLLRRLEDE